MTPNLADEGRVMCAARANIGRTPPLYENRRRHVYAIRVDQWSATGVQLQLPILTLAELNTVIIGEIFCCDLFGP